ncbi:MAG: DUF1028 domain-containing protein [Gammaproteobacteria bacterium]
MSHVILILLPALLWATQTTAAPQRPVNTYSIVAYDPVAGQIGVAAQSHWFCVGCTVTWAEAGVGAVATQSFIDPSYGALGLDIMRAGRDAPDALRGLLTADDHREIRQIGMIDAQGQSAAWTGDDNIQAAGHVVGATDTASGADLPDRGVFAAGEIYAVQANLMDSESVWPGMARAFEDSKGDLAERMLAALEVAQRAGGDSRGRQSAALIVVGDTPTSESTAGRVFDLRVDDNPRPLSELRRLLTLARAYRHMNAGDLAIERADNQAALRAYSRAAQLVADEPGITSDRQAEMLYWHAVALVNMRCVDESLPLFRRAFALHDPWREITPRLAEAGLLPDKPALLRQIDSVK